MDILIKGMDEIPEDGAVLVVRHDNGKAYIKHACTYGYSMELVKLPAVQPDLSGYSSRLWENAYERGKAEAEADKDELLKILKMAKFEYEEAWRIITHPTPDVNYADKNRAQVILDTFRDSLGKMQCTEVRVKDGQKRSD